MSKTVTKLQYHPACNVNLFWQHNYLQYYGNIKISKGPAEVVEGKNEFYQEGGPAVSNRGEQNKSTVMRLRKRRYSPSFVGYFDKERNLVKEKKILSWIPVNASENQARYSCCQLI